jgi:hypothetical protein
MMQTTRQTRDESAFVLCHCLHGAVVRMHAVTKVQRHVAALLNVYVHDATAVYHTIGITSNLLPVH